VLGALKPHHTFALGVVAVAPELRTCVLPALAVLDTIACLIADMRECPRQMSAVGRARSYGAPALTDQLNSPDVSVLSGTASEFSAGNPHSRAKALRKAGARDIDQAQLGLRKGQCRTTDLYFCHSPKTKRPR